MAGHGLETRLEHLSVQDENDSGDVTSSKAYSKTKVSP